MLPLAPIALMPPSFLSSSSRVNFLRWGMEKLTAGYDRQALVAVLNRLPLVVGVPFVSALISGWGSWSFRFLVEGSGDGCEPWESM